MRVSLVILILLMTSCVSKTIIGTYVSKKSPYRFDIMKDSTFRYQYKFQFAYEYSSGYWKSAGRNKIKLKSNITDKSIPVVIKENNISDSTSSSMILNIETNISKSDVSYYQCLIYIDDSLYLRKNCDSLFSIITKIPRNNIYLRLTADSRIPARCLDTLTSSKCFLKNRNINKLDVKLNINDSLFNYKVFDDEKIKVFCKKLKYKSKRLPPFPGGCKH
jgi:hypothetical protein